MPKHHSIIATAFAAALALSAGFGCTERNKSGSSPKDSGQAPPAVQTRENADQLLEQAAEAERRGNYARAIEIHEQLRSFPENARPGDLDQRIEALRAKQTGAAKPR